MAIARDLLDILACPKCRGPLALTPAEDGLACGRCSLCYPIEGDIPVMIVEEAKPWPAVPSAGGGR